MEVTCRKDEQNRTFKNGINYRTGYEIYRQNTKDIEGFA